MLYVSLLAMQGSAANAPLEQIVLRERQRIDPKCELR